MGMEGINWEEVNSQAASIRYELQSANENIARLSQEFANNLSYIWASGNAVTFGQQLSNAIKEIALEITKDYDDLSGLIIHAAQNYSGIFNVPYNVNVASLKYSTLTSQLDSVMKEVSNGITGMNKTEVTNLVDKFKNDITTIMDSLMSKLGNIHISIFDYAEVQREAFDQKVSLLLNSINNKIDNTLATISRSKDEEIDRLDLAKNQTTSTFNQ